MSTGEESLMMSRTGISKSGSKIDTVNLVSCGKRFLERPVIGENDVVMDDVVGVMRTRKRYFSAFNSPIQKVFSGSRRFQTHGSEEAPSASR